jgi:UDP-N-acetylmuramoylalanine--D-glutamate ligase
METYNTALILGYGSSGKAAERLLRSEGCATTVFSQETADDSALCNAMLGNAFDVCIVSPGFSLSHPWICLVSEAGIPLLSELELGWSRHRGKTVAVTGSNGKSTAVKWIAELLQLDGKKAAIGGNYGIPACQAIMDHPDLDWLVLEVSSFQLETAQNFRADVAVLLNLLPNHLDRHESMDLYRRTKARIFGSSAHARDACLVPAEWAETFGGDVGGERQWITFGGTPDADYFFEKGKVFSKTGPELDLTGTLFDSPVLGGCTGAAVAAVADQLGIPMEFVEQTARGFKPLPHRLQKIGEIDGVAYVNDSKATNLAAVAAALQTCASGVHLIAGGLPKETNFTFIKEVLAERAQSIYLTGQSSRAMYQAWNEVCPCVECGSLEIAFNTARNAAKPGETVLLSPGCASFDQFKSFEERGERFIELYQEWVQCGGDTG